MKYEVRQIDIYRKEVTNKWQVPTMVDAADLIEHMRYEDFRYGECDEYDYETHPIN